MAGAPKSCFESGCALVVVGSFVVVLIYCFASETDSSCLGVSVIVVEGLKGLQDIGLCVGPSIRGCMNVVLGISRF